jgi:hypothetical protein
MKRKTTALLAGVVLVVGAAIFAGRFAVTCPTSVSVQVTYQNYQDYWDGGLTEAVVAAGSGTRRFVLHPPREARFLVTNGLAGPIRLWAPPRIQFKDPPRTVEIVPACEAVLPPHRAMQIPFALTGSERGPWRVLIPVSDYRLVTQADACLGSEAITKFLESRLRRKPHWIASAWNNELPQRALKPPAGHDLDRVRQVIGQ